LSQVGNSPGFLARTIRLLMGAACAFLLFQFITLYLAWPKQMALGIVSIILAILLNRMSSSRLMTIGLMIISMTATLRYGWWRIHTVVDYASDAANQHLTVDWIFMFLLLTAELYTMLIMVLGYMQTARPLGRKPLPLPADDKLWPHVDVLIPSYNEELSLVRYTVLAANAMDYPPEKLHVYILDDGSRADFKQFAADAGVGYVTRLEHNHAKAGNINHALTKMDSPFVAIFDCDHVPTRSFLQMTMGWLLADNTLAMLQTPHHFYSPDPFERNLLQYKTIPSEDELFYGIVQDGNDLWDATFFCGSCAVLRRTALDEVGGIAVETVTEDAHTSLRMQKLGWGTAYINIAQAAGLATAKLSAHVGQRVRWARGMIQILRTDNPLFAGKMKLTQRLCYFNAMMHFMYAVPRLVFLLAPLVYMLLGRVIIPGYWVAIVAYAMPHLVLASMTNSRVQSRYRHSFWNEIYETVLSPYILGPTVLAMINPKLGKFNVTDKGETMDVSRFDRNIARPVIFLLFLNFLGVCMAPYRMFVLDPEHRGTILMNLFWVLFNVVILGVAAAVAYEHRQLRHSVRIVTKLTVVIQRQDGTILTGKTIDMSVGGASTRINIDASFFLGEKLRIRFPEQTQDAEITAVVVGTGKDGELRLEFDLGTIADQETLTRALYSRADSWIRNIDSLEADRPLISLLRVCRLSVTGIYQVLRDIMPFTGQKAAMLLVLLLGSLQMHGQTAKKQKMFAPPATTTTTAAVPAKTIAATPNAVTPPSATGTPTATDATPVGYKQSISLHQMGLQKPISMSGPHSYYSAYFTLPYTVLTRTASLQIDYHFAAGLSAASTSLKVMLNDTLFATLTPTDTAIGTVVTLPMPADLLQRSNTITFEFTGNGVLLSAEQAQRQALAVIDDTSAVTITGDMIPFHNDLSLLPLPFFDSAIQTPTTIPFVFLAPPDAKMLQAAGAVASWFGILASSTPVRFHVVIGKIPTGNAVVFMTNSDPEAAALQLQGGGGGVIALRTNPNDANSSLLVLSGSDEDALLAAAGSLSLHHAASSTDLNSNGPPQGDTLRVTDYKQPALRQVDDAPRWLPPSKSVPLGSFSTPQAMQTDGSQPIPIYFRVPPDQFYGEKQNLALHLGYRYNAAPLAAGSMLRIYLNTKLITEIPLLPGSDFNDHERWVVVPVEFMRPSSNTLMFSYDFNLKTQNGGVTPFGSILNWTALDTSGLHYWTRMPNLELFANAGYPFTRFSDLAETVVVMPTVPSAEELELYLLLMSHCGMQTGTPALHVTLSGQKRFWNTTAIICCWVR